MKRLLHKAHRLLWGTLERSAQHTLQKKIMQAARSERPFTIPLLFGESWKLQKLLDAPGSSVSVTPDGYLYTIGGKSLLLTDWNDIFIAADSFVDFDYSFAFPGTEHAVVFDVGANIGDTAFVFASNPRVEKVFSFEPLPSIYRRLKKNIEYNPALKDKIQSYAFGLGDKDATIRVTYPESCSYCATGTEDWHGEVVNTVEEDMSIRDAVPVIVQLLAGLPEEVVRVMKLDCEGAEFSLLPHLSTHGLLRDFSLIMMEFHRTDPSILVTELELNGFTVFWQSSLVGLHGRLYAAKIQQ